MEKKLEVKNLRISFRTDAGKVQAVRGIDFDLYKGETLAIVGESGSGKSVTNKAIIGISAPNAIVESGEIIYDGMDLLQINEEEFHKLRGDKIAMIFQDPLSALDPINRIGMQLTEAMILKNRANRRESRKAFNTRMKLLCAAMNDAMGVDEKSPRGVENAKLCKDFDTFECLHLKLEGAYNVAYENAENGLESADDLLFHIEKNAVFEFARSVREIVANAEKSVNEYVSDSDIVEFAKAFRIEADNVRKTRDKINKFLVDNKQYFGFLDGMHLEISSSNSFPHSSGIASCASSMSALVMCLLEIEKTVNHDDTSIDLNKASFLSRLASGSASRSVYPVMALWGETPSVIGSSDEFAVSVENMVAPIFKTYHDSILIVSSKEKSISSRVGHSLMDNHPWAVSRYEKARHNTEVLIQALQQGDIDTFIEIAESEALQLHELMHTSNPPFDLMMPETMKIIEAVRHYRTCCNIPLCFTLDAGPNVHLLYPDSVADDVVDFIKKDLVKYCVDNKWIDDIVG